MGRGVVLLLFAVLAALPGTAQADVQFDVTGKWTCRTGSTVKPLAGARVEFWRSVDYWFDDHFGTTYTNANGDYRVTIKSGEHFTLYVRVVLRDDKGTELENWYSPWNWYTETSNEGTHGGTNDFGTWEISHDENKTPKCAIWQGASNAYADYRRVVGSRPRMNPYKIDAEFPCCGVPWTSTSTTHWPGGYPVGANESTSKHEFAHAFRHSFDGDFGHFAQDAARFLYPQFHEPCKKTNSGFAFNEGWAEYWADSFPGAPCAGSPDDLEQEGNVAAKLKALEQCSSRPQMVRVLAETPTFILGGKPGIHSYDDFAKRWEELLGRRFCPPFAAGSLGGFEQVLTQGEVTAGINDQIASYQQLAARLARKARRARDPVEATALSTQSAQARLVIDRLKAGLEAAQKARFDPSQQQAVVTALTAGDEKLEQANRKLVMSGLRKGMVRSRSRRVDSKLDRRRDLLKRATGEQVPPTAERLLAPPEPSLERARKTGR
jgi:hypothetical protein